MLSPRVLLYLLLLVARGGRMEHSNLSEPSGLEKGFLRLFILSSVVCNS